MNKTILISFLLFVQYFSFAQNENVYAKAEITSVTMNEHRKSIDTSIVITLDKFEYTKIISLGKIDEFEIGLQLELFKSNLGEKNKIILGMAFFTKEEGNWKMYQNPTYGNPEFKTIASRTEISEQDISHASTGIQDLQVEYQTQVYIIKK